MNLVTERVHKIQEEIHPDISISIKEYIFCAKEFNSAQELSY